MAQATNAATASRPSLDAMNDWELIQQFAQRHDEAAFAELVRRHAPFVHESARRQIGPALADDVTQAVFLVLVRKATSLRSGVILSSWLFRTTRFVAAQARRGEARRSRRELDSLQMNTHDALGSPDSSPDGRPTAGLDSAAWSAVEAHLDDALASLPEQDRRFVLARFFERRRYGELAAAGGVSEAAAKKRVARALEKLRGFLSRRGLEVSAAALAAGLGIPKADALPACFLERLVAMGETGGKASTRKNGVLARTRSCWRNSSMNGRRA